MMVLYNDRSKYSRRPVLVSFRFASLVSSHSNSSNRLLHMKRCFQFFEFQGTFFRTLSFGRGDTFVELNRSNDRFHTNAQQEQLHSQFFGMNSVMRKKGGA